MALSRRDPPQPVVKTQREIARVTADRERLIDLRVKNKITEEQFDQRDRKLAGELRDLAARRSVSGESSLPGEGTAVWKIN
jgi:hypothetical protein